MAHRLAWEEVHGPLAVGLIVHHRCENKLCVNVDHMEAITRKEHGLRHMKEVCIHGHSMEDAYTFRSGKRECRPCMLRRQREARERA